MNAIPESCQPGWKEVHSIPIHPVDEPLVPLSLCPEKILVRSAYFQAGISGSFPECYAREKVQSRLMNAAELLPEKIRLVILDGWRSPELQTALFQNCVTYYQKRYPEAGREEIDQLTRQFVAMPSVSNESPSPHLTGGAIDLVLADRKGCLLPFGSPFDYAGELSHTRYFENLQQNTTLSSVETTARDNRRLLYAVMTEAGFINYHQEWWHFEFNTQRWALLNGRSAASYGPITLSLQPFS